MFTVTLADPIIIAGKKHTSVTVDCHHINAQKEGNEDKTFTVSDKHGGEKVSKRYTKIIIAVGEEEIVAATAYCFIPDNFSRLEGRKRAISRCFRQDRNRRLTRANRTAIFNALCPGLVVKRRKKKEA